MTPANLSETRGRTLSELHLATIQESAQIFASAAAHNYAQGRTCFAHEQQKRADKLKEIVEQHSQGDKELLDFWCEWHLAMDNDARRALQYIVESRRITNERKE